MTATDQPIGPRRAGRQLRAALRALREDRNLTQEQIAEAMDWSISKVIRAEAGTVGVGASDVRALARFYKLEDDLEARLLEMSRVSRRRTWLSGYRGDLPPAYATCIGLEAEADEVRYYQSVAVPGLLQTEDYAAAVVPLNGPEGIDVDLAKRRVEVRMARQRWALEPGAGPRIRVVLDEAVLRRMVGNRKIMAEQVAHLMRLSRDGTSIQVLPFDTPGRMVNGPFLVLGFVAPEPSAVYVESALDEQLVEDSARVAAYEQAFKNLSAEALSGPASLALMRTIRLGFVH